MTGNRGARTPVSLFRSADNGETWARMCDFETGPGEYSYPVVTVRGRCAYLTYTWRRVNIAYWKFKF